MPVYLASLSSELIVVCVVVLALAGASLIAMGPFRTLATITRGSSVLAPLTFVCDLLRWIQLPFTVAVMLLGLAVGLWIGRDEDGALQRRLEKSGTAMAMRLDGVEIEEAAARLEGALESALGEAIPVVVAEGVEAGEPLYVRRGLATPAAVLDAVVATQDDLAWEVYHREVRLFRPSSAEAEHGLGYELRQILWTAGHLSHWLILFVFLPALVFESAFNLEVRQVLKNIVPIVVLAVPVLLFSTLMTGGALILGGGGDHGLSWPLALLIGGLISATDPVAVVALFKNLGAPKRLGILVEGESLFNDGTAIVVVTILLGMIGAGDGVSVGGQIVGGVGKFALVAFGGLAVGILLAWLLLSLIGQVMSNTGVEVSFTLVLAYAAFVVAEHFLHVSGVMACVAAGLLAGSFGLTKVSPRVEHFLHEFWEYLGFAFNSLIFFLVGLVVTQRVSYAVIQETLPLLGILVGAMLISRAVGVFGSVPLLRKLGVEEISAKYQAVMFWGGLRGAVSLALALLVSAHEAVPAAAGETILFLAAGGVLFTLIINALTMGPLIVFLGLDKPTAQDRFTRAYAELERVEQGERVLETMTEEGAVLPSVLDDLRKRLEQQEQAARTGLEAVSKEVARTPGAARDVAAMVALGVERQEILRRFGDGELTEPATKALLLTNDVLRDQIKTQQWLPAERTVRTGPSWEHRALARIEVKPVIGVLARRLRANRLAQDVEAARGLYLVTRAVEHTLQKLEGERGMERDAIQEVVQRYGSWRVQAKEFLSRLTMDFPEYAQASQALMAERHILRAETRSLEHLHHAGLITDKSKKTVEEEIMARELELKALRPKGLELDPFSLLRRVPAFSEIDERYARELADRLVSRTFPTGEAVVTEGEEGASMFIVARGGVNVVARVDGNKEVPVASLAAGEFFGEIAALLGGPRRATVRAATPVNLLELTKGHLYEVLGANPDLAAQIRGSIYPRALDRAMAGHSALRTLSQEQRRDLATRFEEAKAKAGDRLTDSAMIYVVSGEVEQDARRHGAGRLVASATPGAAQSPVEARSASTLLVLSLDAFKTFSRDNPSSADALAREAWDGVDEGTTCPVDFSGSESTTMPAQPADPKAEAVIAQPTPGGAPAEAPAELAAPQVAEEADEKVEGAEAKAEDAVEGESEPERKPEEGDDTTG